MTIMTPMQSYKLYVPHVVLSEHAECLPCMLCVQRMASAWLHTALRSDHVCGASEVCGCRCECDQIHNE